MLYRSSTVGQVFAYQRKNPKKPCNLSDCLANHWWSCDTCTLLHSTNVSAEKYRRSRNILFSWQILPKSEVSAVDFFQSPKKGGDNYARTNQEAVCDAHLERTRCCPWADTIRFGRRATSEAQAQEGEEEMVVLVVNQIDRRKRTKTWVGGYGLGKTVPYDLQLGSLEH